MAAIVSLLSDERAKHFIRYIQNGLAGTLAIYLNNPDMTQAKQDFYRGVCESMARFLNLKRTLEQQLQAQQKPKDQAKKVGSAGY